MKKNVTIYSLLFLLAILFGCGSPNQNANQPVDTWEAPTLNYKAEADSGPLTSQVTTAFKADLHANDRFEFTFKGSPDQNLKKQNSIVRTEVSAKCADNLDLTENVFLETFSLGRAPTFLASDLTPPQLRLENKAAAYCAWTITIANENLSTKEYSLPTLPIQITPAEAKIKIFDSTQKEFGAGSRINPTNLKTLSFTLPASGATGVRVICDLLEIESHAKSNSLYELIANASNNETLRELYPVQRCFIELKTTDKVILRSASYITDLRPDPKPSVSFTFMPAFQQNPPASVVMAHATLRNPGNQKKTFAIYNHGNVPLDILFFDDAGSGGIDLPKGPFHFRRKTAFVTIHGANQMELDPHEKREVDLVVSYEFPANCPHGGQYSRAGFRIPLDSVLISEEVTYVDKRGKKIELQALSQTEATSVTPMPYFMLLLHPKLFHSSAFERGFEPLPGAPEC